MTRRNSAKRHRSRYLMLSAFLAASIALFADPTSDESEQSKRSFFKLRYQSSLDQLDQKPTDPQRAIEYAAAAFDWAELAQSPKERVAIAEPAIAQCRKHLNSPPYKAQAHYYLALNIGQVARTKWLGALRLVPQMEEHLLAASRLKPTLDHGGPHRALSRLYFQAPGWPTSIGSRRKAKQQAQLALKAAPNYPGNHLNYLEILTREGSSLALSKQSRATIESMAGSRSDLNTPYWKYSWIEWEAQLANLQKELKKQEP